jgi:hypothetical protein
MRLYVAVKLPVSYQVRRFPSVGRLTHQGLAGPRTSRPLPLSPPHDDLDFYAKNHEYQQ